MKQLTKQPWMKFFPADWRSERTLNLCSLAARGLWMEMLCLMGEANPRGSLTDDNGAQLTTARLAKLVKASKREVEKLLEELESENVFSRDPDATIFSRRMRRDVEKAEKDCRNGGLGGNPKLKGAVNPLLNRVDKAQKPESRSQKPEPDPSSLRSDAERAICDRFFAAYPKFDEPDGVRRELERILGEGVTIEDVEAGVKRYAKAQAGKEARFIASPVRWLRDGRWKDGPGKVRPEERVPGKRYSEGWLTAKDTPQGLAWVQHRDKTGARPSNVFEHNGVSTWFFPSEWPPSRPQVEQGSVEHAA